MGGHEEEGGAEDEEGGDEPDEVKDEHGLFLVAATTADPLDKCEETLLLVFVLHTTVIKHTGIKGGNR